MRRRGSESSANLNSFYMLSASHYRRRRFCGLLGLAGTAYFAHGDLGRPALRARARSCTGGSRFTPPVSILKSLKGVDPHMYAAFRSHCVLDYPEYEVLFGVQRSRRSGRWLLVGKTARRISSAQSAGDPLPGASGHERQGQQSGADAAAGPFRARHDQRQRHCGRARLSAARDGAFANPASAW